MMTHFQLKRFVSPDGSAHVVYNSDFNAATRVLTLCVATWDDEPALDAQQAPALERQYRFYTSPFDPQLMHDLPGLAAQHPLFGTDDTHDGAWDAAEQRWVSVKTLQEVRDSRWGQIKTTRMEVEFGGFAWGGSVFDSDAISQSRIQGAVQLAQMALAAGQPWQIDWTLQDNTVRTLTAPDMFGVGVALGQHVAACHETARVLREAIEAAQTTEEIEAVTWPIEP